MNGWRAQRFPSAHPAAALFWRGVAFALSLVISAAILALKGSKPLSLGYQVLEGSFGSIFDLEDLALLVTPLILTGLAVAVALRAGIGTSAPKASCIWAPSARRQWGCSSTARGSS